LTKPEHLEEWYMPRDWGRVSRAEMDRDEADFEKDKASGWVQGTEIAADQFVAHVMSMK